MKIIHIADLHARWEWYRWLTAHAPEFDLVVLAGDLLDLMSPESLPSQQKWVAEWLDTLPTPCVICSGNHDLGFDSRVPDPTGWLAELSRPGRVFVDQQTTTMGGLTISALPWGEFSEPPLENEWGPPAEQSVSLSLPICDVLVVHCPPSNTATSFAPGEMIDYGDEKLAADLAVAPHRPTLVLCGHVHRPRRWYHELGNGPRTWVLNPGCDPRHQSPTHIVIDTDRRVATRVRESRRDVLYLRR